MCTKAMAFFTIRNLYILAPFSVVFIKFVFRCLSTLVEMYFSFSSGSPFAVTATTNN